MKTAIVTGASSGLGAELVRQAAKRFPDVGRFILIARREDRLRELALELPGKETETLALDLCDTDSFGKYDAFLEERGGDVALLINNSGCGYLGAVGEGVLARQNRMIDLNVRALTAVTHLTLPYMARGAHIINISSIASFCPNPRMTVYSSTKAYVSSFSRGLGEELRARGISVTAVCPGPMRTEFLDSGGISGNSPMFDKLPYCEPEKVAAGAVKAALRGRAVYTPRAFFKLYRVVAKLLPQRLTVKFAKT